MDESSPSKECACCEAVEGGEMSKKLWMELGERGLCLCLSLGGLCLGWRICVGVRDLLGYFLDKR